jgi:hypothetical protein
MRLAQDLLEELAGRRVAGGFLLLHDARHADLEELVEVGADDREEADPLQQGDGGILRELKHAAIEAEPTEFAVKHLRVGIITAADRLSATGD